MVELEGYVLPFCVASFVLQKTTTYYQMKKPIAIAAALIALTGSAYAQLAVLPPSSTTNGVNVQPIGINAGITHWDANPGLGAYNFASDGTLPSDP